jgi:hypothetical protein
MKAVEFKSKMKNKNIRVPNNLNLDLSDNDDIRVIVLYDERENEDKEDFKRLTKDQFLAGYSDSDEIYDNY